MKPREIVAHFIGDQFIGIGPTYNNTDGVIQVSVVPMIEKSSYVAAVVSLTEDGDLQRVVFSSVAEAQNYIETLEYKAYLIRGIGLEVEDHT